MLPGLVPKLLPKLVPVTQDCHQSLGSRKPRPSRGGQSLHPKRSIGPDLPGRWCAPPGPSIWRSISAVKDLGRLPRESVQPDHQPVQQRNRRGLQRDGHRSGGSFRAGELAALVPAGAWERLSCADGSKGPRLYDWALIETADPGHWLLARRSLRPGEKGQLELAFFRCWSPRPPTLPELAAMAGARWGIEDCFAEAKNETGLDQYQVRKYQAWHRHVILSMLAHAFLAVTARSTRPAAPHPPSSGNDNGAPGKKGTRGLWTDLRPAEDI